MGYRLMWSVAVYLDGNLTEGGRYDGKGTVGSLVPVSVPLSPMATARLGNDNQAGREGTVITEDEKRRLVRDLMKAAEQIHAANHPDSRPDMIGLCTATAHAIGMELPVPWWLWHMAHDVIREVHNGH